MAGNEWVFLSRQRADFKDLGYPGLGDEVCKGKPANQSRQEKGHWGSVLGHPGLSQKCSRALLGCSWAAPGCCCLLLVFPAVFLALLLFSWTLLLQFCLAPRNDFRAQKFSLI